MVETVANLITGALEDLGAVALGETPEASEFAACLRALNNMIETWNTESLMVYNIAPHVFTYVAGQASYTLGTGGDFNMTRPIKIESAYNRTGTGSNQVDYPMLVTDNANIYSDIITKQVQTTLPVVMYYDGNFPLQSCYFWPVPSNTTYAPVLWTWEQIASFAATEDVITLPPGYKRALQKNLAVEVAPAYGKAVSNDLKEQAVDSKAQLKRNNYTIDTLQMPTGIPGAGTYYALPQFLEGI